MSEPQPSDFDIFSAALELPSPEERAKYLDEACGENADLRRRIERLLDAHPDVGEFMESPAVEVNATVQLPEIAERPGTIIGRYKLLQEIGEGGFGVVFMAEQQEPVIRRVALKVIKPGMDTKEVVARFEAERQALALMDHPNIANVLDAGATESGRPYFIMELVKGIPITDYCEQNDLTLSERLNLFTSVCRAIHHAHQKGVIHRDLKPSNILVTLHDGKPVVKVIDFGIAKALNQRLTERTLFTRFAQVIGTPLYMSPEQAEMSGLDVDTRSDIYSLGVLLYELLTGSTPFDQARLQKAAIDEIRRIIRDEEPPKPSTKVSSLGGTATAIAKHRKTDPKKLSALLHGDLDWIVMKSLEKDRTRRYETAKDLADDVLRHIDHKPVEAGPPSTAYRFTKFMKRHKAAATVTAVIMICVLLGLLGTSTGLVYAIAAKKVAEEKTKVAIEAVNAEKIQRERAVASERKERTARVAEAAQRKKAEQNERTAYWNLYVARQFPLIDAWKKGEFGLLDRLLDNLAPAQGEPDFRGWEYGYFRNQCNQKFLTLANDATTIAISPNGKNVAVAHKGGTVTLWSTLTWTKTNTLEIDTHKSVRTLAWSSNSDKLACGFSDGELAIHSLESEETTREVTRYSAFISSLSWSPDDENIAVASQNKDAKEAEIRVFDVSTGDLVATLQRPTSIGQAVHGLDYAWTVAWSPDGTRIATGHRQGLICLWDAKTWKFVGQAHAWSPPVKCIVWDPLGKRFATSSSEGDGSVPTIEIWDRDGVTIKNMKIGASKPTSLFWAEEDKLVIGGLSQAVTTWDIDKESVLYSLPIHSSPIKKVLAKKGTASVVSMDDKGRVRASFPERLVRPAHVFLTDGTRDLCSLTWSPTGEYVFGLSSWGRVYGWDSATCKLVNSADTHAVRVSNRAGACIGSISWTKLHGLVTVCDDGIAISWDSALQEGRQIAHLPLRWANVAVSPNGKWLAVCRAFENARIIDLSNESVVCELPETPLRCCIWTADSSRVFVVSKNLNKPYYYWDSATKTKTEWQCPSAKSEPQCLAVNNTGSMLALGLANGSIQIIDTESDKQLATFQTHAGEVTGLDWAPDQTRLATIGNDGMLRIWDTSTLTELLAFSAKEGSFFRFVKWSNDGHNLAAACGNEVHVFRSVSLEHAAGHCDLLETGQLGRVLPFSRVNDTDIEKMFMPEATSPDTRDKAPLKSSSRTQGT